jgi:glycosyltransferase involved in cell wall biosynthesis
VLTRNSIQTIKECLEAIEANEPGEVIVVDGGSTDGTIEIARAYTQNVLSDSNLGKSHARNMGARSATMDFVAYVDSDILIPPKTLKKMLDEIQGLDATSVSSIVRYRGGRRNSYWSWAEGTYMDEWYRTRAIDGSFLGTQCCLIRRQVILSYGFETRFGGGMDDRDMQSRLVRDGHSLRLSSTVATHLKNQNFTEFLRYKIHVGVVRRGYLRKYGLPYLQYFPLATGAYWAMSSCTSGQFELVPYHVASGAAQTLGFLLG